MSPDPQERTPESVLIRMLTEWTKEVECEQEERMKQSFHAKGESSTCAKIQPNAGQAPLLRIT